MQLLEGRPTAHGTIAVTLLHADGLTTLEGRPEEIAALATAMREVAALAGAIDGPTGWLPEVVVGDASVEFRVTGDGVAQLRVTAGAAP